ncbi:MAG: rhomboid family intramembrane serine protease [Dysgonamonadaceae bacterium]|jgi:membrane associated rhomboid family serine protease|nr:rhomboid family intramembrane serine protease [Dysgonamonadaceae bacterium]
MKMEVKKIRYALLFPTLLILLFWLTFLLEHGLGMDWRHWGIFPRALSGLRGILTEPFIHSNLKHLFSNTVPLLILGWCLFYFYNEIGFAVVPSVWLLSGFLTWLIGRESWHIGASGLVFALTFFLFFSGIFRRYIPLMAVSLLVVFLYGSTLWNMFPIAEIVDPRISWEGHLSGGIAGGICAVLFRKYGPQKPAEESEDNEEGQEEPEEGQPG